MRRPGFSLFELMIGLIVLGVALGLVMRRPSDAPRDAVDDATRLVRLAMDAARAEAMATRMTVHVYVDTTQQHAPRRPATMVVLVPPGSDSTAALRRPWTPLLRGAIFGRGEATTGPNGAAIATSVPTTDLRCDADGTCAVGAAPVYYYVTSPDDARQVRAIMVAPSGAMRTYIYEAGSGGWR